MFRLSEKRNFSEITLYKIYRIFKSSKVAIFEIELVYKNTRTKSGKPKRNEMQLSTATKFTN